MNELMAAAFLGPAVMVVCFCLVICNVVGLRNLVGGERICFYRVLFAVPINVVLMVAFWNAADPPSQFVKWFAIGLLFVGVVIVLGGKSEFLFYESEPNSLFKKYFLLCSKVAGVWLMICGVVLLCF